MESVRWCLCGIWLKEHSKDEVGAFEMILGRSVQLEGGERGGSRGRCGWRGRQGTGSVRPGSSQGLQFILMLRKFFHTSRSE